MEWSPPAYPADFLSHYNLYRDTNPGTKVFRARIEKQDTTFIDTQVAENEIYFYHVTAVYQGGYESPPSNELIATPGQPDQTIFASLITPAYPQLQIQQGCSFDITFRIYMTQQSAPNNRIGSFSGRIIYPVDGRIQATHVAIVQGTSSEYFGYAMSSGRVEFHSILTSGNSGVVDILNITMFATESVPSLLDLQLSTLSAAETGEDLLRYTHVRDITVTPQDTDILLGDVDGNGMVNSTDALVILSHNAGYQTINPEYIDRIGAGIGDVNRDGHTNSTDTLILLSHEIGAGIFTDIGVNFCF